MEDAPRRRDWVLPARTGVFDGLDLVHLDRNDLDERRVLILAEHPDLLDAVKADEEVVGPDGEPMNPSLHISMHELVVNQIWDADPPETWETAQRLTALGYERHEVLHMLSRVVAGEVWQTLHGQRPFDLDRFRAGLAALPDSWEDERTQAAAGPSAPSAPPPMNRAQRRAAARQRRRRPHGH